MLTMFLKTIYIGLNSYLTSASLISSQHRHASIIPHTLVSEHMLGTRIFAISAHLHCLYFF